MTWNAIIFDVDAEIDRVSASEAESRDFWPGTGSAERYGSIRSATPQTDEQGVLIAGELQRLKDRGVPVAAISRLRPNAVSNWFEKYSGWCPPIVVGDTDSRLRAQPTAIHQALRQLGVAPTPRVLVVGGDAASVLAAFSAGVTSGSFIRTSTISAPADIFLPTVAALHDRSFAASLATDPTFGTMNRVGIHSEQKSGSLLIGGKYHKSGGIIRDAIRRIEYSADWPDFLYGAALDLVAHATEGLEHVVVTTIPPKPGMSDRFETVRHLLSSEIGVPTTDAIFTWAKQIGSVSDMVRRDRYQAMAGALHSDDVRGLTVVVLDENRTTGATLDEASRAIKFAGGEMIGVSLTQTVTSIEFLGYESLDDRDEALYSTLASPLSDVSMYGTVGFEPTRRTYQSARQSALEVWENRQRDEVAEREREAELHRLEQQERLERERKKAVRRREDAVKRRQERERQRERAKAERREADAARRREQQLAMLASGEGIVAEVGQEVRIPGGFIATVIRVNGGTIDVRLDPGGAVMSVGLTERVTLSPGSVRLIPRQP